MHRLPKILCLAVITWPWIQAATVRVENLTGNISAKVTPGRDVRILRSSPARETRPEDVAVAREPGLLVLRCQPADGARIDLELELPYGTDIEARTASGAISLAGFVHSVSLTSDSGDIAIAVPWAATRLEVSARNEPKELVTPDGLKFSRKTVRDSQGRMEWRLRDRLPDPMVTYGDIRVHVESPGRIVLSDAAIPEDSPVKLPWQAREILDSILRGAKMKGLHQSSVSTAARKPEKPAAPMVEGVPVFTSDVRMVNLTVTVYDSNGHPYIGLKPRDFEVVEDGAAQEVSFAGAEDVPFNLALLLDLSGSTRRDRPAMKEAARRFLEITRPQDRVAAYGLAGDLFHVVSRLTTDRESLLKTIEAIPEVSGSTPLYDAIVLSYAEEFRHRPSERNALIILSDGIDNELHHIETEPEVSFKDLRRAAREMHELIYPVFLDPFDKVPPPGWSVKARERLQALANATGGRLFSAQSVHDLEPVYPLVAEELRSVYTVAYYPRNQNFDGAWRNVQVRVKPPGARVRTRDGYYAR